MLILDKAFNYANAVTQNKIIANSYVKKQCKKFLEDIDKCKDEEYPYFFNYKEIELIEGILSLLNFASGVGVAGLPLLEGLADFQCFILVNFFGFKHKNNPQKRKIETLVLLIARKNAKTFLSSLIILLLLILDEPYSEFYSVSVDSTLSGIVKKELKQLLEKSQINHHFQQKYNRIIFKSNQNFYVNLHGDADRLDGRKISGAILDECGLYADMGLINAMETGAMASINRSFVFISTAYETDSTVFKSKIEYMERVLDGQIEDASIFGLLYRAENPLEWDTDKALLEANPICYVSKPHLDYLKKHNIYRYEVSNFAKFQKECKHNLVYWNCQDYLGLGLNSHSKINNERSENFEKLKDYFNSLDENKKPIKNSYKLSLLEQKEEFIMLNLRKAQGINLVEFKQKFNEDLTIEKNKQIENLKNLGLIEIKNDYLFATDLGFKVLNQIILELV